MVNKIILEGTDLIGKTTLSKILKNLKFNVKDRIEDITKHMILEEKVENIQERIKSSLIPKNLYVILYTSNTQILQNRLQNKNREIDEYDKDCIKYNLLYQNVFKSINEENILKIDINNKSLFEICRLIVQKYVQLNLNLFHLDTPTFQGESKKFYVYNNIALVSLKPTLYSFTHNRYGTVDGTDDIRCLFWELFGGGLNDWFSKKWIDDDFTLEERDMLIDTDVPFLSNFLGNIKVGNTTYNIVRFFEEIPPIEIVWKKYMVGTMKHNLYTVDCKNTINRQKPILYEGAFPNSIVRFDWRNPLPHKDECIPEDFAAFYINVPNAKKLCRLVSYYLEKTLKEHNYKLVDLCYFMDYDGKCICAEITPDGMRIKQEGKSFDKDLWRQGKDKDVICKTWLDLYNSLKE